MSKITPNGFTLVETLIASVIIATMVLTFYGISSAVVTNLALSNQRATAAQLAISDLEALKASRNLATKDSRTVVGSVVGSANAWDTHFTGGKTGPTIVGSPSTVVLDNIPYTKVVTLSHGDDNPLPRLGYRDVADTWQSITTSEYQADYWQVSVTVSWPGPVSTLNYTISTIITNWQQARPTS